MTERICAVFAHCDDELIFGWPLILAANRTNLSLLICSSDEHNPERQWCKKRKEALAEVCDLLGIRHVCLPFSAQFYKLPHRPDNQLRTFVNTVHNTLADFEPDCVFTHNTHGEYGHFDHRFLSQMLDEISGARKLFTDMYHPSNWPLGAKELVVSVDRGYSQQHCRGEYRMQDTQYDLYLQCKAIYDRIGCWTWSDEVIKQCNVYWK